MKVKAKKKEKEKDEVLKGQIDAESKLTRPAMEIYSSYLFSVLTTSTKHVFGHCELVRHHVTQFHQICEAFLQRIVDGGPICSRYLETLAP